MKDNRKVKKQLRNGCSRTEVFISPKNYKSLKNKSDLQKDWFVECRFFDPQNPKYDKGFQFRRRPDRQLTIAAQKKTIEEYKVLMENYLDIQNFNPITKAFMTDDSGKLSPYMDFKSALFEAQKRLIASKDHLKQIEYAIIRFCKGLDHFHYSFINISDVKIYHIKNTLEYLKLPPYYYNKFRGFLITVFKELIEYGCINHNPIRDINKKKFEVKPRKVFSDKKARIVFDYLKNNYPDFFRYGKIFFYSGGRSAELLRVQKKHVNLENQEYLVQIQKGRQFKWVMKVITDEAFPYWKEIIDLCKNDEDYLFSARQVPGQNPIKPAAITRRWYRLVKSKTIQDTEGNIVEVYEDFYSWKYLFLDKIEEMQHNNELNLVTDINLAQSAADHTTNRTTGIYATGRKKRENEILKRVKIGI